MSGVTCPMSPVIFCLHASFLKQNEKKKIRKKWTKGWRVCYQWGLPRLIFDTDKKKRSINMTVISVPYNKCNFVFEDVQHYDILI